VLIMLISQLFPVYVKLFPPNHAYSVFGVFLVLTFWLYLVGIVMVLGAELNAFLEQPARSAALAEATAAAQRGKASYDQSTGQVRAEASGDAPALRGGGPFGAPSRSPAEQFQAEQQPGDGDGQRKGAPEKEQPRVGMGGRIVGLVGLLGAALLLRGGVDKSDKQRAAA